MSQWSTAGIGVACGPVGDSILNHISNSLYKELLICFSGEFLVCSTQRRSERSRDCPLGPSMPTNEMARRLEVVTADATMLNPCRQLNNLSTIPVS